MQETIMYRLNRAFFLSGVLLYLFLFLYWGNSINYYNILNVVTFLSYAGLIWLCMKKEDEYFTYTRLSLTVFVYSIIFVGLYLLLADINSDYMSILTRYDVTTYEKYSFRMKDMGFPALFSYLSQILSFDDRGAPLAMAVILKIVPSKFFFIFSQILMNVVGALCLFSISKSIMPRKYGYTAVLVYTISSYSIFFMSCMLKEEMMTLLVILSVCLFYKYRERRDSFYIILGGVTSLLILFFRVPVAVFVWLVYAITLLLDSKGHVQKGLVVILIIAGFILSIGIVNYSSDRYVNSTASYMYGSTSLFQKAVLALGALFGPFPELLQLSSKTITYKSMYAPGLLYKFFLFFPFWKGFVYCLRSKATEVVPLFLFCLLEIAGLISVFDGLELRKAFPHFSLFILASFWFMSRFDIDTTEGIRRSHYYYWTYKEFTLCICIVLIITLAWNTVDRV